MDATELLHKLEIIVGSLVHSSLGIIRLYKLQHQTRTVHLTAVRSIQPQLTQWKEEISLFRETTGNTGDKEMCFALLLCLAMLIYVSDCRLNKNCHKAGVCSRPPHAHLSESVTAPSYRSMGQGKHCSITQCSHTALLVQTQVQAHQVFCCYSL